MNHHYKDIRDKLGEPTWWDEHGVPRYCDFGPGESSDIYASEIALLEIACQNCDARFRVCMSWGWWPGREQKLSEQIVADTIHYGDPPNAGCCGSGPTMNSEPIGVLEFWDNTRPADGPVRRPEFERAIDRDLSREYPVTNDRRAGK